MSPEAKPFRIVSLVPSLTETVCELGLRSSLVGCTHFCVEPKGLFSSHIVAVGGTKDPSFEAIVALKPTHILLNDEENTASMREQLHENAVACGWEIVDTFPLTVFDVPPLLMRLGSVFKVEAEAVRWKKLLEDSLSLVSKLATEKPISACYFIWRDPWMVAGNRTFIAAMLSLVGIELTVHTGDLPTERYPAIAPNDPRIALAQALLFSSEPFPFRNRQIEEFEGLSRKSGVSFKVDGQLLSWYGTRSVAAVQYLGTLRSEIEHRLQLNSKSSTPF